MPLKIGLMLVGETSPALAGELTVDGNVYTVIIYRDGQAETYTGTYTPEIGGFPGSRATGGVRPVTLPDPIPRYPDIKKPK